MLLADHAEAVNGKLYINGGGWTRILAGFPSAVALVFQVPWDEANEKQVFDLELLDADGGVVGGGDGQPIALSGDFETGRPPGMRRGTPTTHAVAVNIGPLPLVPGTRYEWRLTWNGENHEEWSLPFETAPVPQAQAG